MDMGGLSSVEVFRRIVSVAVGVVISDGKPCYRMGSNLDFRGKGIGINIIILIIYL